MDTLRLRSAFGGPFAQSLDEERAQVLGLYA